MWSGYDEDLTTNPFFKEIKEHHLDILSKACDEHWIICIPRTSSLDNILEISSNEIVDHILLQDSDLNYCTLSKKRVFVENKCIKLENYELFNTIVEILFEETHYLESGNKKYTLWCIERPLFMKQPYCDSHCVISLTSIHDCIDFLWAESLGHEILENIQKLCSKFFLDNKEFELECLQNQRELIGELYSQCLQICLKLEIIKEKTLKNSLFVDNLKLSVETYMQYCLGRKLIYSVNTLNHYSDSVFNKIVRNSFNLKFEDLNISSTVSDLLASAKSEISKINFHTSVLDKTHCLRKTFDIFVANKNFKENVYVTSDDFLQILVFLIVKSNVNNWVANLTYLKEFKFCSTEEASQDKFLITSLEAALEFIKSNEFFSLKSNKHISDYNVFENSFKILYEKIKSGTFKSVLELTRNKNEFCEATLCHPLCLCQNCENLVNFIQLEGPISTKIVNRNGQNILMYACIQGDIKVVEFLLAEDCDIDVTDNYGKTSLHYAAALGFQDILLLLINFKANVNICDKDKNTPLHLACDRGQEACVKALIFSAEGVEVNLQNDLGETPLFLATKWGYFDIVRLLLECNASICLRNKRNQTVYQLSPNCYISKLFENFCADNSKNFIKEITDVNQNTFKTAQAARMSNLQVLNCKEHGVRPKSVEEFKNIDLLLKAIENNDLPLTCFYLGFDNTIGNSLDSVDSAHSREAKCHPLCTCEKCQNDQSDSETEVTLCSHTTKVNINACNIHGFTALHMAAKFGRTDILRMLLDSGGFPNLRVYRTLCTPLHLAVLYDRVQIVRELLKCGNCEVDAQDVKGNTPLFYACLRNEVRIVEILLINGADCTKKNYEGVSPLDEVEEKNQYRIFKLLKKSLGTFRKELGYRNGLGNPGEFKFL